MASLYDRADIYDLLENEQRYNITKEHWAGMLAGCYKCLFRKEIFNDQK